MVLMFPTLLISKLDVEKGNVIVAMHVFLESKERFDSVISAIE